MADLGLSVALDFPGGQSALPLPTICLALRSTRLPSSRRSCSACKTRPQAVDADHGDIERYPPQRLGLGVVAMDAVRGETHG